MASQRRQANVASLLALIVEGQNPAPDKQRVACAPSCLRPLLCVAPHFKTTDGSWNKEMLVELSSRLHAAVSRGDMAAARWLISQGADPLWLNEDLECTLHAACTAGKVETIAFLVDDCGVPVDANPGGTLHNMWLGPETPLTNAAAMGHVGAVQFLLERRADVNYRAFSAEGTRRSVLLTAVEGGHLETAQILSSYRASRHWLHGYSQASACRASTITRSITGEEREAEAAGNARLRGWLCASRTWTPLHHIEVLSPERTRRLLREGENPHGRAQNASDDDGCTPLDRAQQLLQEDAAVREAALRAPSPRVSPRASPRSSPRSSPRGSPRQTPRSLRSSDAATSSVSLAASAAGSDQAASHADRATSDHEDTTFTGLGGGGAQAGMLIAGSLTSSRRSSVTSLDDGEGSSADGRPSAPPRLPGMLTTRQRRSAEMIVSAAGPWSVESHTLRPLAQRRRAVDLVHICYGLKRDCMREQPYALLDAWLGNVIPAVLEAEAQTAFLASYASDGRPGEAAPPLASSRRQPSVAAVWGYGDDSSSHSLHSPRVAPPASATPAPAAPARAATTELV